MKTVQKPLPLYRFQDVIQQDPGGSQKSTVLGVQPLRATPSLLVSHGSDPSERLLHSGRDSGLTVLRRSVLVQTLFAQGPSPLSFTVPGLRPGSIRRRTRFRREETSVPPCSDPSCVTGSHPTRFVGTSSRSDPLSSDDIFGQDRGGRPVGSSESTSLGSSSGVRVSPSSTGSIH